MSNREGVRVPLRCAPMDSMIGPLSNGNCSFFEIKKAGLIGRFKILMVPHICSLGRINPRIDLYVADVILFEGMMRREYDSDSELHILCFQNRSLVKKWKLIRSKLHASGSLLFGLLPSPSIIMLEYK